MELTKHLCSFCSYIIYLNLKVIFSGIIIIFCKYYKFCVSHCTLSTKEYFLQKRKYRKVIKTKKRQAQEKLHSILLKVKYKNPKAGVPLMNATLNMIMFADDIVLLSTSAQGLRKHL